MVTKIVKSPKGKFASNFNTDFLGRKFVDITFRRRGRLGKLFKSKNIKRIRIPKGMEIVSIHNHSPRVRSIRIVTRKIKGR